MRSEMSGVPRRSAAEILLCALAWTMALLLAMACLEVRGIHHDPKGLRLVVSPEHPAPQPGRVISF